MNAQKADLDAAARLADSAMRNARRTYLLLGRGENHRAGDFTLRAGDDAENALGMLIALGAKRPSAPVAADNLPLHLLDTPATRRLLELLREAEKAAADVDREREWMTEDGEPCGWAETLGGLALKMSVEVEGPRGRE